MPQATPQLFFSTYARTLISDWQIVKQWIQQHSISALKEQHHAEETPPILNQEQLDEVSSGPYHTLIKNIYAAYAKIIYARQQLKMFTDEAFKDFQESHNSKLSDKQLEKIKASNLTDMQKALSSSFSEQTKAWETVIEQWQHAILSLISQYQITDREREEYTAYDPLSEILDRFKDLNLEVPKPNKKSMNFSTYLHLKTYLLIYSALSRQHMPHSQTDINAALKPLKNILSQIHQQDRELNEKQKSIFDSIIQPLEFLSLDKLKPTQ